MRVPVVDLDSTFRVERTVIRVTWRKEMEVGDTSLGCDRMMKMCCCCCGLLKLVCRPREKRAPYRLALQTMADGACLYERISKMGVNRLMMTWVMRRRAATTPTLPKAGGGTKGGPYRAEEGWGRALSLGNLLEYFVADQGRR